MSDFISGHDLLKRWDIRGFELFNYVSKGKLRPYDRFGKLLSHPYSLSENKLKGIKGLLKFQEDTLEKIKRYPTGQDSKHLQPLEDPIVKKKTSALEAVAWLKAELYDHRQAGSGESQGWKGSQLPEDEGKAQELIKMVLESLYHIKDVAKTERELGLIKKLRPSQIDKIKCREIAEKLWIEDSSITITAMVQRPEILELGLSCYSPRTRRKWIQDLCPNRKPGRRPKKTP